MRIQAIVALDLHFGIAKNGVIPWKSPLDILFFRYMTFGNIVIMGYSTFISLPNGPLDNRLNIVLTKKPLTNFNTNKEHLLFMNNIQDIFHFLHTTNFTTNPVLSTNFQIFIIGGKQIYELFYPYIDTFWVSQINDNFHCDVVFNWNHFLTQFSIKKNVLTNYELSIYTFEHLHPLHHFSFNPPTLWAEMNEKFSTDCASSMRKGVRFNPPEGGMQPP